MWGLRALFSLWGLTLVPEPVILDSGVHLPVLYDSFVPPALGQTYADQTFTTPIKRLSDAVNTPNHATSGNLLWIGTEYPTASPWNVNNSWLILQHQGYYGLYDGNGTYVRDLPFSVNASTEPRWSRTDPNVLFYVSGNTLRRLDISAGTSTTVRTFSEYSAIRGRGESDISRDGDHFVFAADAPGGLANRYVFVYEISSNTKGPVLDTIGQSFNQLYLASDNSVALGWIAVGTARFNGVELFDRNMNFQRQLTRAIGHMHLTRDTNNADVLIWANSNDPQPIPNCPNGIVKVRLSNAQQTCLLQLDWSLAVHITAGDGDGWAFVETYDPADPAPSAPAWKPYSNEIMQVKLDGTEVRRLLHHRSRQTGNYEYQPRATISRDGTTLVYSSTYNMEGTAGHAFGYTDVYLAAVPDTPQPLISIADASVVEGNGGTVNLTFPVTLSHMSTETVTVQFQTLDGTASAPADYAASGLQTLTFPPLTASRTISVAVVGDTVFEADETLQVVLSNPTNATLADASGLGTIVNDEIPPPIVVTAAATALTDSTVTLNGTVNANGLAGTAFYQYGLSTSYGATTDTTALSPVAGAVSVPIPIDWLQCNTLYHFRLVATSATGTTAGADKTFTTLACPSPPTVTTSPATSLTQTGATLEGTVDPNLGVTYRRFEYGVTAAYGVTSPNLGIGAGNAPVNVSLVVNGLACNATYHFRAVGQNSGGTTYGTDRTFLTAACPAAGSNNIGPLSARSIAHDSISRDSMSNVRAEVWYRVRLFASRSYQLSAWPVGHEQGTDAPALALTLFSDDGGVVAATPTPLVTSGDLEGSPNNPGDTLPASMVFQPVTTGVYKVRILRLSGGAVPHSINVEMRDTTLFSPWTSRAAGFEGFIEMRNNTNASVAVTLRAFNSAGAPQGAGLTIMLPPNSTDFRTAAQVGVPVGAFAGVVLTHAGAFGAVTANITTLNGAVGLSFDSPFSPRSPHLIGLAIR